jgi:hypothetical protein
LFLGTCPTEGGTADLARNYVDNKIICTSSCRKRTKSIIQYPAVSVVQYPAVSVVQYPAVSVVQYPAVSVVQYPAVSVVQYPAVSVVQVLFTRLLILILIFRVQSALPHSSEVGHRYSSMTK